MPLAAYVSASVVFVLATWEGCMESLSSLSPTGLVQAMMSQSAEATSEDEPAVQQVIVRWSQVFLETVQDNRLAVMVCCMPDWSRDSIETKCSRC